jgi:integrase
MEDYSSDCFPDQNQKHTPGHKRCPACATRAQKLMQSPSGFRNYSVQEAGSIWQQMRAVKNLKPRAHEFVDYALGSLSAFFGDLPLGAITAGHFREYQLARTANELRMDDGTVVNPWKRRAGHSTINHELNVLSQMLSAGGLWERIRPWYAPLKMPSWSPREIPNPDEEARLWSKAAKDPGAELAMLVATITANTSASGSELRYMRLRHLFLRDSALGERSEIWIPEEGCKNNARPRKIPLNNAARWAFSECYRRALRLGATDPDHFLFPFRELRNQYDPTRPATRAWLRKSWARLREVTGLPKLSPHDLRHVFCSKTLAAGARPEVVRALMGHKSQKMTDYYSHWEMEPKAEAVDKLDGDSAARVRVEVERKDVMRERRSEPREPGLPQAKPGGIHLIGVVR